MTSLCREYKEKLDLKDHNEDDTVSFNPRDYFIFKRELSGGLTGDEVITIPHMAILVSLDYSLLNNVRTVRLYQQ
jgi:hypothetical protein